MPATPIVTVGLPFFNAEGTLRVAIESILSQELRDFELILVNDGSTDRSPAIAREYAADEDISLVDGKENLGLAPRLNQLTALSRGFYVARMDADDVMHPERLLKQISLLEANPSVDLVGTSVYVIDGSYRILGRRRTELARICHRFSYLKLFHPTVTGKKAWFTRNPYSSEFLRCEDTELWIRALSHSEVRVLDEPLLFFNRVGTFEIAKTLRTLEQLGQIYRLHRDRTCGWCRTRNSIVLKAKAICYRLLWRAGLAQAAARRFKVEPLSPDEKHAADRILFALAARARQRQEELSVGAFGHQDCND